MTHSLVQEAPANLNTADMIIARYCRGLNNCTNTVGSKNSEYGHRMVCALVPAVFGFGLEDGPRAPLVRSVWYPDLPKVFN